MDMISLDEQLKKEFENLPADFWDFKESSTRDLTHGLHCYPATMVFPISQNILKIVQKHCTVNSLFDPFMGSGTVLIEGMTADIPNVYGTDLNPLAYLMTKVKTTPLSTEQLDFIKTQYIQKLKSIESHAVVVANDFDNYIRQELKLDVTAKYGWGDSADKYISKYFEQKNKHFNFQKFVNLGFWFLPKVIIILQTIKNTIKDIVDSTVRDFLLIAFSETVRLVSNTRNSEFKLFRINREKLYTYTPDTFNTFYSILYRNIGKMDDFIKVYKGKSRVFVSLDDTRQLKSIPDNCIDLVITSPPYGDSRTTVAYGQYSRLSLQWLDLDYTNQEDIISVDKKLLGGKPYCYKEQWGFLGSNTLVNVLEKIVQKDYNRADDVFSFYVDLDKCLYAIRKKMKPQTYQFWVVGNRTVKSEKLHTDKILAEMAKKYGLTCVFTFGRNISNKVMPTRNSPTNVQGKLVETMTKETVVVLKKER